MAARLVPFPARSGQTEIAGLIRRYLGEMSSDRELVDTVAAKMDAFIDRYINKDFEPAFDLAVPVDMSHTEAQALLRSVERGVDDAVGQFDRMICEIIIERLFLEAELYRQRQQIKVARPACRNSKN